MIRNTYLFGSDAEFIESDRFGKNFTYAPQGHKSSFVNTCILSSRAWGDHFSFVGDMDEIVEYRYGNKTSVGDAILHQLAVKKLAFEDTCGINLGSIVGHFHPDKVGFSDTGTIAEKLYGVKAAHDSVGVYGKTISNVRRVLRAGLHSIAYCEGLPTDADWRSTRKSVMNKTNTFRPDLNDIRILH